MISATRSSGISPPTGFTVKSSTRSPGAKTTALMKFGCRHHFIDDGYLPSILPAAAAIAARTERIRIACGVLLMPFHNPIRLAEDIATVDIISGGRLELGVGIGFKQEEFAGFGVSSKERGKRTDQAFDIIRRALAGETITFKSEFFDFQNVRVTPEPIQKPHQPIWLGGFPPA